MNSSYIFSAFKTEILPVKISKAKKIISKLFEGGAPSQGAPLPVGGPTSGLKGGPPPRPSLGVTCPYTPIDDAAADAAATSPFAGVAAESSHLNSHKDPYQQQQQQQQQQPQQQQQEQQQRKRHWQEPQREQREVQQQQHQQQQQQQQQKQQQEQRQQQQQQQQGQQREQQQQQPQHLQ
ncbi:hypothetical protein Emag_007545 [Eimeria magna]